MVTLKADFAKKRGSCENQFDFSQSGRIAQNINIALNKLTESASLRLVRPPYAAHLQCLERRWKRRRIIGVIAA